MRRYNAELLFRLKTQPCTDCGHCFSPDAMDFDHVRGVKLANISDLVAGSTARLLAELHKTELVCANCHRLREMHRRLDAHVAEADAFDVELD
jgi:nitrate/TMAO reductase-like tetraheme cytochrome c subunit